jgi:hypothetical protein
LWEGAPDLVPVGIGVAVWLWFLDFDRHDPDTTCAALVGRLLGS